MYQNITVLILHQTNTLLYLSICLFLFHSNVDTVLTTKYEWEIYLKKFQYVS